MWDDGRGRRSPGHPSETKSLRRRRCAPLLSSTAIVIAGGRQTVRVCLVYSSRRRLTRRVQRLREKKNPPPVTKKKKKKVRAPPPTVSTENANNLVDITRFCFTFVGGRRRRSVALLLEFFFFFCTLENISLPRTVPTNEQAAGNTTNSVDAYYTRTREGESSKIRELTRRTRLCIIGLKIFKTALDRWEAGEERRNDDALRTTRVYGRNAAFF